MAETIASAIFSDIFKRLTDEALKKYARSQNIHSELDALQSTLSHIQALLIDASDKEVTHKSVGLWLNRLQHLAYDIDDILDGVATKAMHHELTQKSRALTSKVKKFIVPTWITNLSLSESLHEKLDDITTKLQHLEKQKNDLGLIEKNVNENSKNNNRGNESSLLKYDVVGREGEKEILINKLLGGGSSKETFGIVPIVGMGGVGKTTLARLLYNDTKVEGHFELKAWVCVSDDFDVFKISETILQDVTKENKIFKDLNQLQTALTQQFKGKKFLLVVDDVWSENFDEWENLVSPFHSCAPGSRIIMTTRKEKLLKTLGFDHLDRLERLSDRDALSLFALHALGVDTFDSHLTLRPKGEGIVGKCGGLPLALKAIGRLLRTKAYERDWDDVLNSEIWNLENGNVVLPALRLSYHDLPAHLKQLFAYCSLFPKDFLFDKEDLVLLWMAQGYMNETSKNKSPERIGNEYFENLLSRSFFQEAPNDKSSFVMHDLMSDLATFVSGEYFLRFDKETGMTSEALEKYRHTSFVQENYVGYQKFEAFKRAKSLRTFLGVYVGVERDWERFYFSNMILVDVLPKLPLLRVLSLKNYNIRDVSEFIGNLKHLRYFNLSQTEIQELPENVANLYNLQTLIVSGCKKLTKLPKSFVKLKKLRHLDMRDTPLLKKLPLGIGELRNLQTLTKIIVGGNGGFVISELSGLTNLNGEISIEGLHNVQSSMHAREANLTSKELTRLELKWDDGSRRETLEKEVLNELKPHAGTLSYLGIEFYSGIEFPSWVGDLSFHQLIHVSIRGCENCTSLPSLGQLPLLKELFIEGLYGVESIGMELTDGVVVPFPSLETLSFENMSGWEVWSTDNKKVVFPRLRKLHIENCQNLIHVSLEELPTLRDLVIKICRDGVLTSVVQAASSIIHLDMRSVIGLTYEVWRGVIKYLRVVEEVTIWNCHEIKYLWESEGEASKFLVNLKRLEVWSCDNLMSLGEKEDEEDDNFGSNFLPSFKSLNIFDCKGLERVHCPNSNSIEYLCLWDCESLTRVSFPTTTIDGATGEGGQKLKSLYIIECENLSDNINNANMPMLEVISIDGWKSLKSITKLSTTFNHLTVLQVSECQSLESLPELSTLTLLKDLEIYKCPRMSSSFPSGVIWPPKLVGLTIGGFRKPILEWGLQNFPPSLVDLTLYGDVGVSDFSQLSHLLPSSLTKLEISEFGKLKSLSTGLQHLTSLQHLRIEDCPKMKHLPVTLLPSLLSLEIEECPKLQERCSRRGSHYWPLISHIPRIFLSTGEATSGLDIIRDNLGEGLEDFEQKLFENLYSEGVRIQDWRQSKLKHMMTESANNNQSVDIRDSFMKAALKSRIKVAFGIVLDSMLCGSSDKQLRNL